MGLNQKLAELEREEYGPEGHTHYVSESDNGKPLAPGWAGSTGYYLTRDLLHADLIELKREGARIVRIYAEQVVEYPASECECTTGLMMSVVGYAFPGDSLLCLSCAAKSPSGGSPVARRSVPGGEWCDGCKAPIV